MINRRRLTKTHRLKESLCDRCVDVHQRRVAITANPRDEMEDMRVGARVRDDQRTGLHRKAER